MRIPRISPGTQQLSKESPNRRMENADSLGGGLQIAGQTVSKISSSLYEKMNQARDYAERLTAKRKAMEGLSRIVSDETNALNEVGERKTGNETDYLDPREKIRTLKEGVLKGFSNKDTREQFSVDYDLLASNAESDISNIYRKNIINQGQAETQNNSDTLVMTYPLNSNMDIEKELSSVWDEAVRKGFYDADTAYRKKEAALKEARNNLFIHDAQMDRAQAKRNLEKNIYKFNPKEMDTALSTLVHFRELEQKNELLGKIDKRYELVESLATGKESLYALSQEANTAVKNDDVLAEAISRATKMKSGYYAERANEETVQMFKEASAATDRDKLSKIAASVIYRNKSLSADKLGALLFYASKRAKTLKLSEKIISPIGDEDTALDIEQKKTDAGINAIARWARFTGAENEVHGEVLTEYMKKVQSGKTPYEAVTETLRETNISLHPEMVTYPETGQLIIDGKGNQAIAYPNGDIRQIPPPKAVKTIEEPEETSDILEFEDLKRK